MCVTTGSKAYQELEEMNQDDCYETWFNTGELDLVNILAIETVRCGQISAEVEMNYTAAPTTTPTAAPQARRQRSKKVLVPTTRIALVSLLAPCDRT